MPPTVDFTLYRVVAVVDAERGSGGYSVEISSVELDAGDQYSLTALFSVPDPTLNYPAVITKPYHIVKVAIP